MRHRDGVDFEVSVVLLEAETKVERMALEAVAITVHRVQHGRSPQANFGGVIAGYRLSSANNAALVAAGKRFTGGPDPTVSASVSVPVPGPLDGEVCSGSWLGLDWSPWRTLDDLPAPATTGLYRLRRSGAVDLLYVGQGRITSRVRAHRAKSERAGHRQAEHFAGEVEVSWVARDLDSRGLLEIENDAIASHRLMRGVAPVAQFIG